MTYRELTFQMLGSAIVRRWKTIAVTLFIFLALGGVSGSLFAPRASAENSGSAAQWQAVDFATVTLDLDYYSNCHTALSEESSALYTYVDTVRLDTTLTEEQYRQLLSLCEEITKYRKEVLTEISEDLSVSDGFYIPSALRQKAVEEYSRLRDKTEDQIIKAAYARELLQSIGGLTSTNEDINATYASVLSQAAQYGQLQLNLERYQEILDRLENDYARVQADSREMESRLEQAAEKLNKLGATCYQTVEDIAKENHLDITIHDNGGEPKVLVDHTTRLATQQEAFLAFVLFFGLLGICVGIFAAVCREYAVRKKDLSAPQ